MVRGFNAWAIALAVAVPLVGGSPTHAGQVANAGLHAPYDQTRFGSKECVTGYEHGGEGILASMPDATKVALRRWDGFAAWEYGKAWVSHPLSAGKVVECQADGASRICRTTIRPCRQWLR